jgi:hypothetical protein
MVKFAPLLLLLLSCNLYDSAVYDPNAPTPYLPLGVLESDVSGEYRYFKKVASVAVPPCVTDTNGNPIPNPYRLAKLRLSGWAIQGYYVWYQLEVYTASLVGTGGGVVFPVVMETDTTGYVILQDARYTVNVDWYAMTLEYTGRFR